ncbi:Protein MNN4 [Meyerozyma sp. JA9]|nr:Protein MNN4 [Meyerozyma sp. JA9]
MRVRFRYLKVVLLFVVTYGVLKTIYALHLAQSPQLQFQHAVKLKFQSWFQNILASDLELESNESFLRHVERVKEEKLAHDWSQEFWDLDEKVTSNLPLELKVPSYFTDDKQRKPIFQPFDPRFTLGVYLSYLNKQQGSAPVPFHWSDWVDMEKLKKYVLPEKDGKIRCSFFDISNKGELVQDSELQPVQSYCREDDTNPLGYNIFAFPGPQMVPNNEILGKSYLYTSAPSPVKLVFLTDNLGSYEVYVANPSNNDLKHSLLHNGIVKVLDLEKVNVLHEYKTLVKTYPPRNGDEVMNDPKITIPRDAFDVDVNSVLDGLKGKELNVMEDAYRKSIEYSHHEEDPPKFFREAKLLEKHPEKWLGDHYDWRFFNGLTVGNEDQKLSLHHLVKSYLSFARQHGIVTWISHGSLLSWYWNGLAFPWDTDIDVQVPISDLHKLGKRFNQSLIIENIGTSEDKFNGMGRYFVDIGSSITHRSKGNGNNNIDGRFIDIDTGLYIDITALALTDTPTPQRYDYLAETQPHIRKALDELKDDDGNINYRDKNRELEAYNCRNNHFATYDELSPLVLTLVENSWSYVPSNFVMTLNYEYKLNALTDKNYRDSFYLNNFRIWVTTQIVLDYLQDPQRWVDEQKATGDEKSDEKKRVKKRVAVDKDKRVISNLEKWRINKLTTQDHANLLQHGSIFKEYVKTMHFTSYHEKELGLLMKSDLAGVTKHMEQYTHKGEWLRSDLFMNKVMRQRFNFEEAIDEVFKLMDLYAEE